MTGRAAQLDALGDLIAEFTLRADEARRDGHPAERHRWDHLADRTADIYRTIETLDAQEAHQP